VRQPSVVSPIAGAAGEINWADIMAKLENARHYNVVDPMFSGGIAGTGAVDDHAPWQAAIDQVMADGGLGVITAPPNALCRLDHGLLIPIQARELFIVWPGGKWVGNCNEPVISVSDLTTAGNRAEGVRILGFPTIDGPGGTDNTKPLMDGLSIGAAIDCFFQLKVQNLPGRPLIGVKSAQPGSAYWNHIAFDHFTARFCGQGISVGETGAAADDVTFANGLLVNNLGQLVTAPGGDQGGVHLRAQTASVDWVEMSAIRNDATGTGYQHGLVFREAAFHLGSGHFEANCSNQAGSSDLFCDTDCQGGLIGVTEHSCGDHRSAQIGVDIACPNVTLLSARHDGGGAAPDNHVLTNLVVARANAKDTHIGSVCNLVGTPATSGELVRIEAGATGQFPPPDGGPVPVVIGTGLSFGNGNIVNVAPGIGGAGAGNPSIDGNDHAGAGSFTPGAGAVGDGIVFKVLFHQRYSQKPRPHIHRANSNARTTDPFFAPGDEITDGSGYFIGFNVRAANPAGATGVASNFTYHVDF
jgi:hypothetical protein